MRARTLNPKLINQIARLLFNGFDDSEISSMVNLPPSHIKALRLGNGDSSVKKLSLELKDRAIERIKRGNGRLGGLIWFVERRFPRQFARPDVQLSLSAGNTVNQTLVISADVAEGLIKRSKTVQDELTQLITDKNPDVPSDAQ